MGKRYFFIILALPSNYREKLFLTFNLLGLMLIVYIATGALLLGGTLILGSNLISQRGRK